MTKPVRRWCVKTPEGVLVLDTTFRRKKACLSRSKHFNKFTGKPGHTAARLKVEEVG